MTMFNLVSNHSLIGRKFVIYTVFFSSFITLLFTVTQLVFEYDKELEQRILIKKIINDSLLDSLSKSIWTYDDAQIDLQLQGIVNIPTIERVVLELPEHVEFNIGKITSNNIVNYKLDINYKHDANGGKVGVLVVYSEMDSTYNHLLTLGIVMLTSNLFKTSLVILFMLFLFDRFIGRYLMKITYKLAKYNDGDKNTQIDLKRNNTNSDEIDLLVDSINNMQQRIYFERNKSFNELKQKEEIQLEITEQKEKLLKLEHKVSLSEIFKSLADELNSPLINIDQFCGVLLQQIQSKDFDHRRLELMLGKVKENSRHASDIVNRTKEIMKRSEPHRISLNINHLITRSIFLLSQELKQTSIEIQHHASEQYVAVYADELQMEQVLVNLIRNSIEALCLTTTNNKLIEISAIIYNDIVAIRIEDNGPGLNELIMDKVFTPFFSTREKGVGVGLSIAKTLINSNGGKISINRDARKGACFNIQLPLNKPE